MTAPSRANASPNGSRTTCARNRKRSSPFHNSPFPSPDGLCYHDPDRPPALALRPSRLAPNGPAIMESVLSLILGGGRGTRLYPLTMLRSKPAVPIAGKYRLIDIPISNCINGGCNRIYILTQFLSVSLHRHIANTYKFDPFSRGFAELLPAQQTNEATDWYQGTADAVRQNLRYVHEDGCREVMVLSGDQLYRMDFRRLLKTHRQ